MNKGSWVAAGAILAVLLVFLAPRSAAQSDSSDAKQVPIYLSDFELASVGGSRPAPKAANGTAPNPTSETASLIFADTDPAPVQARRLVDAFGTILAESFRKSGYTVVVRQGASVPSSGLLLRGVFAEPDQENRIRRAILGAGAPGPSYTLYVGVFNLGRQDQPLYLPAVVQSPDVHYGPVITLNAYIPMVKFDVPKNPTDEDVRKICGQIVSQLTTFLTQNPNAVSR
jgi:hypothetical protein